LGVAGRQFRDRLRRDGRRRVLNDVVRSLQVSVALAS
jgi:hypothetical protein